MGPLILKVSVPKPEAPGFEQVSDRLKVPLDEMPGCDWGFTVHHPWFSRPPTTRWPRAQGDTVIYVMFRLYHGPTVWVPKRPTPRDSGIWLSYVSYGSLRVVEAYSSVRGISPKTLNP